MKIINGVILVDLNDSFDGIELFGCCINCRFPIFKENYIPPKLFEFRGAFDDKSETFEQVFKNADIQSCVINGTDK